MDRDGTGHDHLRDKKGEAGGSDIGRADESGKIARVEADKGRRIRKRGEGAIGAGPLVHFAQVGTGGVF